MKHPSPKPPMQKRSDIVTAKTLENELDGKLKELGETGVDKYVQQKGRNHVKGIARMIELALLAAQREDDQQEMPDLRERSIAVVIKDVLSGHPLYEAEQNLKTATVPLFERDVDEIRTEIRRLTIEGLKRKNQ